MNFGTVARFWEFAGAYYRFDEHNTPILVIDREQSVGGYNNSELTLWEDEDTKELFSNDKTFLKLIAEKIEEKENNKTL